MASGADQMKTFLALLFSIAFAGPSARHKLHLSPMAGANRQLTGENILNGSTIVHVGSTAGTMAVATGGTLATSLFGTIPSSLLTGTLATAVIGNVPVSAGGTGNTTASSAFNALSPMTTGGDLIYGGASGAATRLPNGSSGQVLTSAGGTSAPVWGSAAIPTGTVVMYVGSSPPTGWLICDGSLLNDVTFAALFAVIGTTYGGGLGNFNLPDFRGIFPRGAGTNATLSNANGSAFSATLGSYQNDKFQGHVHQEQSVQGGGGGQSTAVAGNGGGLLTFAVTTAVPSSDGTNGTPRTGAETNPANLAVNFIIKM